jgi:proline iminopeptidase
MYGGGAGMLFPEAWSRFVSAVPEADRGNLLLSYHRLIDDPDPQVREKAASGLTLFSLSSLVRGAAHR